MPNNTTIKLSDQVRGCPKGGPKVSTSTRVDWREQLVNGGAVGPITAISIPEANITRLNGILLDVDLKLFRPKVASARVPADPGRFYAQIVQPMLMRHPTLAQAEVRMSGTGLHVILRFDPPVEFETENDRKRWAAIVRVIQRLLPTDPDAPGITAMTRPVGSINAKNSKKVTLLAQGVPVTPEEVLALFEKVSATPVKTVGNILFGQEQLSPCPMCGKKGSRLEIMDCAAKCYGSCGKVRLAHLYEFFLKPRPRKEA